MAKKKKDSKKNLALRQMRRTNQLPTMWFADVLGPKSLPTGFSGENVLWAPAIHVIEKEDKYVAKFDLPGVNEEDIGISVIGGKLIVQGEKKAESEVKKKGYSYRETSYGSFSRSITIPSIVDADWISANFDKGVLEIDLPKAAEVKPKKVSVTTKKKPKTPSKEESIQAYCMKDRKKVEIKNPEVITIKDGRTATLGVCPICGKKVSRIGSKK